MKDLTRILLDTSLNPETRVYRIARELRENNRINDELWYAILDLKEKHFKDILFEENEPQNDEPQGHSIKSSRNRDLDWEYELKEQQMP